MAQLVTARGEDDRALHAAWRHLVELTGNPDLAKTAGLFQPTRPLSAEEQAAQAKAETAEAERLATLPERIASQQVAVDKKGFPVLFHLQQCCR